MKKQLILVGIVFSLIGAVLSGCLNESKKTMTYAELGNDVEIIAPNSLFGLISLFTLKSYKDGDVLYIKDKIFNVSYTKINESLGYTLVMFEKFIDDGNFPLCFIGNKTDEYRVGSTVTIPVHVKTYNITGYNLVWLEEWYWAYHIMNFFYPTVPTFDENVKLIGYVTDEGQIVIEHIGGPPLINYTIEVKYVNGTLIDNTTYRTPDNPWKLGDAKYILPNLNLTKDDEVKVTIYNIYSDDRRQIIFDGILQGK